MSLKAQRAPVRAALTKAADELRGELGKEVPDRGQIKLYWVRVNRHHEKLIQLDARIVEKLLEDDAVEQEFQEEYEGVNSYEDVFDELTEKTRPYLGQQQEDDQKTVASYETAGSGGNRNKYRLPKLELRKFGGDPKKWISFWSQFKTIHEDGDLSAEEKFQYLLQSTKDNSTARSVVSSFPPSRENYPKAIEYLKERFGRDDILVEVYVRELLTLVIHNSQKKTSSLSTVYDKLETQLRALESLGVTSDKYASMLYPLVESSLPEETLRIWERSRASLEKNDNLLTALMSFIRTEVDGEERIKMAKQGFSTEKKKEKQFPDVPTATDLYHGDKKNELCVFCEKPHKSMDCFKLSDMKLEDKRKAVKEKQVCFLCLKPGHISKYCKQKIKCSLCSKRHLTVMCSLLDDKKSQVPARQDEPSTSLSNLGKGQIALQTILVKLQNREETIVVRALFDSGCQHSYISGKAAKVLKLEKKDQVEMGHSLFGGQETRRVKHCVYHVRVSSVNGSNNMTMKVLDQPVICGNVERLRLGPWMAEFQQKGIEILDIGEGNPEIHILFGADIVGHLYTGRIFKTEAGPVALQTLFGWTVTGVVKVDNRVSYSADLLSMSLFSVTSMENLWKLEILGIRDSVEVKSQEIMAECAMEKFRKSIRVDDGGKYEVALPWVEQHVPVADNFELAKKRLMGVVKKLKITDKLELYDKIFTEWMELGIIEEVAELEEDLDCSYMPHRPNFTPSSSKTPVRPVFDASAKSKGLPSLNECLHKGPNLIEEIPAIFTRFRLRRFGVTSDIKKAFLQINTGELRILRHCRVPFGVSSSPFLLGATLHYHLENAKEEKWKEAVEILKNSYYVDNCVASLDSESEVVNFKNIASEILAAGKFDLRGWTWNGDGASEPFISILGIIWNKMLDTLSLDIGKCKEEETIVTLRTVMSASQRVFDPMGFCSPVTLIPKLIIQKLWALKLEMDGEAPEDIKKQFSSWITDLQALSKLEIPRWIVSGPLSESKLSIHGFGDGSKDAYAGCVFLRSEFGNAVTVRLVMSKARVAPQKSTIPRVELLGCLTTARLVSNVIKYMDIGEVETSLWTDSANALYWIKNEDNWGLFVHNRVKEIIRLVGKEDWRHLPGVDNPADLPSRGCLASSFLQKHWWEGPTWLKEGRGNWPVSTVMYQMEEILIEKKKSPAINLAVKNEEGYFSRFSSFAKLVRVVAWMLRSCKRGKGKRSSLLMLSLKDLEYAELVIWRKVQSESLQDAKVFKSMHARKDEIGVRRVRSKICLRKDSLEFCYPILLPSKHELVKQMIMEEHVFNHHAGVSTLMCLLREKYWIIRTRRTVKEVLRKCVICRRLEAEAVQPEEPPLPVDRVRDAEVFEIVGIDLGGPLYLHKSRKVWFVVFSCAVYRALHIEVVSSLSTESLTKSIRRFIARRGRPAVFYSDNGTNFVGLENLMRELDWEKVARKTGERKIEWRFNPPAGPWWGGWYERMVGMVKKLLKRNLGKATLSFEDLETVLFEVEAIINSRPLTYLSEDPEDPIALTPALLMGLKKPFGVADFNQLDGSAFRRKHGELQKTRDVLQKRFRIEYLGSLVHHDKYKRTEEVKVGDIVVVELENVGRISWPLGRVVEVVRGRDGIVRRVNVQTGSSRLTRPIQKIRRMEIED